MTGRLRRRDQRRASTRCGRAAPRDPDPRRDVDQRRQLRLRRSAATTTSSSRCRASSRVCAVYAICVPGRPQAPRDHHRQQVNRLALLPHHLDHDLRGTRTGHRVAAPSPARSRRAATASAPDPAASRNPSSSATFAIPAARFGRPGVAGVVSLGAQPSEQLLEVTIQRLTSGNRQQSLQRHPQLTRQQRITRIHLIRPGQLPRKHAQLRFSVGNRLYPQRNTLNLARNGRTALTQRMVASLVRTPPARPQIADVSQENPP